MSDFPHKESFYVRLMKTKVQNVKSQISFIKAATDKSFSYFLEKKLDKYLTEYKFVITKEGVKETRYFSPSAHLYNYWIHDLLHTKLGHQTMLDVILDLTLYNPKVTKVEVYQTSEKSGVKEWLPTYTFFKKESIEELEEFDVAVLQYLETNPFLQIGREMMLGTEKDMLIIAPEPDKSYDGYATVEDLPGLLELMTEEEFDANDFDEVANQVSRIIMENWLPTKIDTLHYLVADPEYFVNAARKVEWPSLGVLENNNSN